ESIGSDPIRSVNVGMQHIGTLSYTLASNHFPFSRPLSHITTYTTILMAITEDNDPNIVIIYRFIDDIWLKW
ncbi:MAG: hypothetical protein KAH57_00205, partial [Thermoplasmata archaeon]|nr:hypothetical protein [Thermoplasmata archaeon]